MKYYNYFFITIFILFTQNLCANEILDLGKNKNEILNYFKKRINNSLDEEFLEAKKQVKKIATFRLEEIIK